MNKLLNILLVGIIFMVDTSSSILFSQVLRDKKDVSSSTTHYEIISGILIDKETGLGIPFASIAICEGRRQVLGQVSDSLGRFVINLNPQLLSDSIFDMKFTSLGYNSYTIENVSFNQILSTPFYTIELVHHQFKGEGIREYLVRPLELGRDTLK